VRNLTRDLAFDAGPAAGDGESRSLTLLFAALGVLLLARILGIVFAGTDLHYEEARQWYQALAPDGDFWSNPPIPSWLTQLAIGVCGDGEVCLRLPSALFSIAGAGLAYGLAAHLYDRRTALYAAIAYATLPAISAFAMVAMPEVVLAFFVLAALWALAIHTGRPSLLSGLFVGLALGLGFLTDKSMGWMAACALLYLVTVPRVRGVLAAPGTWLAIAITLLLVTPEVLASYETELAALQDFFRTGGRLLGRLNPDDTLAFILLQFLLFGPVFLFVFLRSVVARYNIVPRNPSDLFLLYHSVPIFAVILVMSFFEGGTGHLTLPAYPAAVVFVTALLLRHGFKRLLAGSIAFHVAIMAVIIGVTVFANRVGEVPALDRLLGWRQFAEELDRTASNSEVRTVVLRGGDQVYEALYYLRDSDLEIRAFKPRGRTPSNEAERERSWAYGDPDPVLLATGRDPTTFGIPLNGADKIGEFPVQAYLNENRLFSLYRVNPPADDGLP
jgi:4-amino-4-deoxy-L-arabinose transferase-like glycosyltransferase